MPKIKYDRIVRYLLDGTNKENVEINNFYLAVFDTGARNSYVIKEVASNLSTFKLKKPETVGLGGKVQTVVECCRLEALIEGLPIWTHARVVGEIGTDEEGKEIKVLIGALTMQEWGIIPIPHEERLDLTHYPKEFIEY